VPLQTGNGREPPREVRNGCSLSSPFETVNLLMDPSCLHLSSGVFWVSAGVVAGIDLLLVSALDRRVSGDLVRQLTWEIPVAGVLFWSALWWGVLWEPFYGYLFPPWVLGFPLALGFPYGAVAGLLWWVTRRVRLNPVLGFCALGGIEGLLTHVYAVFGLGALTKPPMMHGVSAASVLTFAFSEKVLYWSLVLAVALVIRRLRRGSTESGVGPQ
jgi:hypothetical protein